MHGSTQYDQTYYFFLSLSLSRQIKMSSPNMNNLIITGCILSYTSVIILGLDSHITSIEAFPYICTARAWILMWGFTLSFGSMFSKTWRVHSIFTNVQLNKKVRVQILTSKIHAKLNWTNLTPLVV